MDAGELAVMVDDLVERIVPSLPEGIRRQELLASLRALRASLLDMDAVLVTTALAQAQAATTRYATQYESAATQAELDDVRLALDLIALQLNTNGL